MRTHYIALVLCVLSGIATAARIKDIVEVQGIRGNSLSGVGLVVGLNGTGDSSRISGQAIASLVRREGITLSPTDLASGSAALVWVTAELGPWDLEGSLIDITVGTLGDCKSLQGGMLLATELKGFDGEVYAVARVSSISTISWTTEGNTGTRVTKNHPTVGRVPRGAYVEKREVGEFVEEIGGQRYVTLKLLNPDFSTAERIRQAIDQLYPQSAFAQNPGTVRVRVPQNVSRLDEVNFVDKITQLEIEVDACDCRNQRADGHDCHRRQCGHFGDSNRARQSGGEGQGAIIRFAADDAVYRRRNDGRCRYECGERGGR